ncbi:hypothetical protein ABK040_003833 [Willaertia magna]
MPTKYKIGGDDGTTTWLIWRGQESTAVATGWEVKFEVDDQGNVSGSNKNEGCGIKKHYTGTLINGEINVEVNWDDGAKAKYTGTIQGDKAVIDCEILAVGTTFGCVGDKSRCEGKVKVK